MSTPEEVQETTSEETGTAIDLRFLRQAALPHDAREKKMKTNTFVLYLIITLMFFGCGSTGDERAGQLAEPSVAEDQVHLTGGPLPISNDDDCTAIRAWVHAHRETLPTSYRELVRFPTAYRRPIFDALSPAAKSNLWRQHLQTYLSAHPRLSEQQIAAIKELSTHVAIAFDATPSEADTALLEHLQIAVAELFTAEELPGLVAHLGPEDISEAEPPLASAAPQCGCNRTDDWCTWGMSCKITACTGTQSGCGSLWRQPCNGLCDW